MKTYYTNYMVYYSRKKILNYDNRVTTHRERMEFRKGRLSFGLGMW